MVILYIITNLLILALFYYALCERLDRHERNTGWEKLARKLQERTEAQETTIKILRLKIKDYGEIVKNLSK